MSLNFESILHLSNRHILCNLANSDLHTIFVNGHLGIGTIKIIILIGRVINQEYNGANKKAGG